MNNVKILVIGTDKSILEEGSVPQKRQVEYFKNFALADILILGVAKTVSISSGNTNIYSYGGASKLKNIFRAFVSTYKNLKSKKYDIIYTQDVLYCGILGYILSKFTNVKFIPQIHGDYLDNPLWINQRKENKVLNKIGIWLVRRADYVRCVSKRIVKQFVEQYGIDPKKLVSLPIGIDGDAFNTKDALAPENRKKQILFVGRMIPEKEPLFFAELTIPVLQKYPEFSVVVIGEGDLKKDMAALYDKAGVLDRIEFTGFLNPMQLARYYKSAYAYIKTAFWEGWGLPMVESSACGLPCISTDTGCAGEVIIDRVNGRAIDSRNAKDFTDALFEIIENKELYKSMCDNAERLAVEWTFVAMREKIEKFLVDAKNS
jgi:glycosyltransferase involved in cell wall biosynthesis